MTTIASANPCPSQRTITRPLLFVHNYSLFFFGSILNIVAFFVLMQGSLRCQSTFAYLAFLSLSNGLLSLVRSLQWMLTYYLNIHFENNLYTCRFYHFTYDFLTHFSLFTLVCVNIDRARTVTKNRLTTKFSRSSFQKVFFKEFTIALILLVYHFHWLVKFGSEASNGHVKRTICNHHPSQTAAVYSYFLSVVYPFCELIIFFSLPFLINITCTILIVRSLYLRIRTAKRFTTTTFSASNDQNKTICERLEELASCFIPRTATKFNIVSCFCCQIQCRRHTQLRLKIGRTEQRFIKYEEENESSERRQSPSSANGLFLDIQQIPSPPPPPSQPKAVTILSKNRRTRRIRDIHLSAMLIILNILYLIFNLPFNFHQTFGRKLYTNNSDHCVMIFINLLLDLLQQTYFSTNFFLYVLTNRRFREEFCNTIVKLFSRKRSYLIKTSARPKNPYSKDCNGSKAYVATQNYECSVTRAIPQHSLHHLFPDVELTDASLFQKGIFE